MVVTIDARRKLATTIPFVRYELTATRKGAKYFVAAVHKVGGATTIVDIRRHGTTRRTPSSSQAFQDVRDAAEAVIRADASNQ